MAVGMQIIGSHGVYQVDQTYRNLCKVAKGALANTISLAGSVSPLMAIRSTDTSGTLVLYITISGSTYTWNSQPTPSATTYWLFDVPPTSPATGIGLQIFDASGVVVFDTFNEYMKIVGVYTLGYPGSPFTGVTEPTGSAYAYVQTDAGRWTQAMGNNNTKVGGYAIAMVAVAGGFQMQTYYSTSIIVTGGGGTTAGPIVDVRQPQVLLLDVTGM